MSTPAALPLALRKQIRDSEDARKKIIERMKAATGVENITWDLEADARAILARNDAGLDFQIGAVQQYLDALATLFERSCEDELVKPAVAAALSKGVVGMRFVDSVQERKEPTQAHGPYNGVELIDGGIFVFTSPRGFWNNIHEVRNLGDSFHAILPKVGGDDALPIRLQQEIRKLQPKIDEVIAKIKKQTGVENIKWDIVGDAKTILALPPNEKLNPENFAIGHMWQYVNALAELFERNCSDDLIKEAVLEVFTSGVVGVKVVDSLDEYKEAKYLHGSYNGVVFVDGGLFAVVEAKRWLYNVSEVERFKIENIL